MKIFNGKIAILNVENISSNQYKLQIRFTDAYMNYSMLNISIGDYVFANVENELGNEELALFIVSNIDELNDDNLIIEAVDHEFMPINGDGLICTRDKIAFLPTSLNGLSQQMIDYARNIDLHNFAEELNQTDEGFNSRIEELETAVSELSNKEPEPVDVPNPFVWHYGENASYLSNVEIGVSNNGTTYSFDVPENGVIQTISFKLNDIGEVETVEGYEEDLEFYSITVDFDINQSFTPQEEGMVGVIPKVEILSVEDNKVVYRDEAFPELIDNHTINFKFMSSIKTEDNSLIAKLTF